MAMTTQTIAKAVKDAKESGKAILLVDAGGLRLRVSPTGKRMWYLRTRDSLGASRDFRVGEYPTVGVAEARTAAAEMKHKIKFEKADPIAEARERRQIGTEARAGIGTLSAILDLYGQGDAPASFAHARKRIDRVFADLLPKAAGLLRAKDFQLAADRFQPRKSAHFAVRSVRPVVKWAEARGYIEQGVSNLKAVQPPSRDRVLSEAELARVLAVLDLKTPHHAALRFVAWTLTRLDETCAARWAEFDLEAGVWTLLGYQGRTKNRTTHKLHLPTQAVALLKSMKPANARPDALVFHTRTGGKLGNWDRVAKSIMEASGTSDWTRHDLRRTGATVLGEKFEIMPDIIEAALNHKQIRSKIASVYNASRYHVSVALALQTLSDWQDRIVANFQKQAEAA